MTTSIYKWIWGNKKQSLNNLQWIDPLKSNSGAVFSHFKCHSIHSLSSPILCPVATFCSGSCLCDRWHSTNISASNLSLHWWAPSVTHHKTNVSSLFQWPHFSSTLFLLQLSSHIQHLTHWHKREVNLWTGCPTKTHLPRTPMTEADDTVVDEVRKAGGNRSGSVWATLTPLRKRSPFLGKNVNCKALV